MKRFELLKSGPRFLVSTDENSKDYYKDFSKYNQNKSVQQLEVQKLLNPDEYIAPNITPMRKLQNRVHLPSLFTWKNANPPAKNIKKGLQEAAEKNEVAKKLEMESQSQTTLHKKQERIVTENKIFLRKVDEEEEATPRENYPKQKLIFDKSPSNTRTLEKLSQLPYIKKAKNQDDLKPVVAQPLTSKRSPQKSQKTPTKGGKARKGQDYDEYDDLIRLLKTNPSSKTGLDAELEELLNEVSGKKNAVSGKKKPLFLQERELTSPFFKGDKVQSPIYRRTEQPDQEDVEPVQNRKGKFVLDRESALRQRKVTGREESVSHEAFIGRKSHDMVSPLKVNDRRAHHQISKNHDDSVVADLLGTLSQKSSS